MASPQIQWYPGHMHKAGREIRALRSQVQVFIEVLDARLPASSANPMLGSILDGKPVVRVLARADLADPDITARWLAACRDGGAGAVLALDARRRGAAAKVIRACRQLTTARRLTVMVVGIPNCGKSTLVNTLAGRAVARTGDEPAVTRARQFVEVAPGVVLLDTPGVMWPRIEDPDSGCRLALTGAIRDALVPRVEIALWAVEWLAATYPQRLAERYRLAAPGAPAGDVLEAIGRARGCLVRGGTVDLERAAKVLVADLRAGRLGRVSLEAPPP